MTRLELAFRTWVNALEHRLQKKKEEFIRGLISDLRKRVSKHKQIRAEVSETPRYWRVKIHDPEGDSVQFARWRTYAWVCRTTGNIYRSKGEHRPYQGPSGNLLDQWNGLKYADWHGPRAHKDIPKEDRALWPSGREARSVSRRPQQAKRSGATGPRSSTSRRRVAIPRPRERHGPLPVRHGTRGKTITFEFPSRDLQRWPAANGEGMVERPREVTVETRYCEPCRDWKTLEGLAVDLAICPDCDADLRGDDGS